MSSSVRVEREISSSQTGESEVVQDDEQPGSAFSHGGTTD